MKQISFSHKKASGIGLIEVLITTVVIAVGLMAIASLQGTLTGGSRDSKTRAEAKALADTKIEQFRDTIEKTGAAGFNALASLTMPESITGVNETFSRSWIVTDLTSPTRKQISVTVSWTGDQVAVQSIVAFDEVSNSLLAAKGAGAGAAINGPSTNAESSDEITKTINLPPSNAPYTPNTIYTDPNTNKTYIIQNTGTTAIGADNCSSLSLDPFENSLLTRRINFDGVPGNEAIELYEKVTINNIDYCIPRLRYNGGVIIPIRGIVHSGATTGVGNNQTLLDVNLFTFNASETGAFCVFKPDPNAKSAPYVCYVGGNCEFGPDGTAVNGNIPVTECPNPAIAAAKVGPGGWRGQIGLLGVAGATTSSTEFKNVCFAEELAGTPASLNTARNYYTRAQRNGVDVNEGINKPYHCHDFLIVNGKQTEAQVHSECVTQASAIAGLRLASKTIQRDIGTGDNIYDPVVEESYCTPTTYTVTGSLTNATSAPVMTSEPSGNCTVNNTHTGYTCTITTIATSATISGTFNGETKTCTVSTLSTSGNTCDLPAFTPSLNPSYVINGTISGTANAANAVVVSISDGGSCMNNLNGTYTCSLTTANTSATITAAIMNGATVTPNTPQTVSLDTPTPTGPTFTASGVYTISGSISIGSFVTDLTGVTVAVDTNLGTCQSTHNYQAGTTGTYSCTVPGGANHLTIAISQACSNAPSSKKYNITDGSTTTSGQGSLVINFNITTSNIANKNISVTKATGAGAGC